MDYNIRLTESYEIKVGDGYITKRFQTILQVLRFFDIQTKTGRSITGIHVSGVNGRLTEAQRLERQLNEIYKTQVI
jgi:3-deoxy-D-arabino-heptulosonate 7-phosphate (DAHP) synthase class II